MRVSFWSPANVNKPRASCLPGMRSLTLACLAGAVTATKLQQQTLDRMDLDELAELQ